MSIEAMTAVLHHSTAKGTALTILLGIANHEGDGGAWPCRKTLAKYGRCTERRVKQIVAELVELGELSVEHQAGGLADTDDHLRPNRYRVLVRCPTECDGTSQHRVRPAPSSRSPVATGGNRLPPVAANKRKGGKPTSPEGGKPASPGGGETHFPLTVLEEPSVRSEVKCSGSGRFAPGAAAGGKADDSAGSSTSPAVASIEPTPRRSQWDAKDRILFEQLLGKRFRSRGRRAWKPGEFSAEELYEALMDGVGDTRIPIEWPGRWLADLHQKGEFGAWLRRQGFELIDHDLSGAA